MQDDAVSKITVSENITRLVPYRPGKPIEEVKRELGLTDIIKLASNENPLGPSPEAIEAMCSFAKRVHLYPDANSFTLKTALSQHLGIDPECLVFGNGSDDIIHLLGVTYLTESDEVIMGHPSFVRYESAATLNNVKLHQVPLTTDWLHDLDAMAAKVNERTRIVFVTNPNNPTGTYVTKNALDAFIDDMPERVIVALDEAYFEYAAGVEGYPSGVDYVKAGKNVVVMRTFSKAYALAGLRIGYGVMRPDIAHWLNATREPFNVNAMAQQAAVAALADSDHVALSVRVNNEGKEQIYTALDSLGLQYTPTFGNFIWFDTGRDSREVYDSLLRQGVITRTGDIFGAPTHLRVTIGTAVENARFIEALGRV